MPITPTAPITIPSIVIDTYWLSRLVMVAPKIAEANALPKPDASAVIELLPYNSASLQSVPEKVVRVQIKDIFAKVAGGDTDLVQIMQLILAYSQKEAKAQGLI